MRYCHNAGPYAPGSDGINPVACHLGRDWFEHVEIGLRPEDMYVIQNRARNGELPSAVRGQCGRQRARCGQPDSGYTIPGTKYTPSLWPARAGDHFQVWFADILTITGRQVAVGDCLEKTFPQVANWSCLPDMRTYWSCLPDIRLQSCEPEL